MTTARSHIRARALSAYYLSLAILAACSFYPEARLWGVNWWAYAPSVWTLTLLGAAFLAPFALLAAGRISWSGRPGRIAANWPLTGSCITIGLVGLFILFRTRTHFLGDGYLLLSRLEEGSVPIRPWNWGVYLVQDALFSILPRTIEARAESAFQVISVASGAALLIATGWVATRLFAATSDRVLFLLGLATGGYALQFFGYVETYPMFVATVAVFCLVGLLAARGQVRRWWIVPPLVVAGAFHPFAIAMLPSAFLLLLRDTPIASWWKEQRIWVRASLALLPAFISMMLAFYSYAEYYFVRFALVPPAQNRFTVEGYTLFSLKHLQDYANLIFLLAPGILLFLSTVDRRTVKLLPKQADYCFLLLASLTPLILCFIVDPKLGMPRDWDMLAFAGVPLSLLLYYLILDKRARPVRSRSIAVGAIIISVLMLTPRVYTQLEERASIALFDKYCSLDPLRNRTGCFVLLRHLQARGANLAFDSRQARYADEYPHELWSQTARNLSSEGKHREALPYLRRLVRYDPSYHIGWSDIGVLYLRLQMYDSALAYFRIADGMNPYNPGLNDNLGVTYLRLGNPETAEKHWLLSRQLNPDRPTPGLMLLALYQDQDRFDAYLNLLPEVAAIETAPPGVIEDWARQRLRAGAYDEAATLLRRAVSRGLDSGKVAELLKEYPALQIRSPTR